MKHPTTGRRSLAVLATTALLASGATALLPGTAQAATSAVITSITPTATNNSGNTAVTIDGSDFAPLQDVPYLVPRFPDAAGKAVGALEGTSTPASSSTSRIVGTVPTSNAAPGDYDVYLLRSTQAQTSAKCATCTFKIASSGAPDINSVTAGASTGNTGRPAVALDLGGQNLAQGSVVKFFKADGTTEDTALTFFVEDPNDDSDFPGYASSALIRGHYTLNTAAAGFTSGKHLLRAINTLGDRGAAVEFWQPIFAADGVVPNAVGAGAQSRTVTVTGSGIRQGSRLEIEPFDLDVATPGTQPDVSIGTATVSADGKTISAPVSFSEDAEFDPRDVTIFGPEGARYKVADAFKVNPGPKISSLDKDALGQGASYTETITGTGFATGSTPATLPVFTVGGSGVTTKTISATNISAKVLFTVASDAATGARALTVTNPDGGSQAISVDDAPFTVEAGPKITSLTPASSGAGTSKTITVKGTDFEGPSVTSPTGKPTIAFYIPGANGTRTPDSSVAISNTAVTKGVNGAADTFTFTLAVAANAPAGLRDVILTNPTNLGAYLCAGCFGVDNLTANPTTGSNNASKQISLTGANVVAGSTAKLVRAGAAGIQPDIAGTSPTVSGTTLTAQFNLTDAAPGPYNAVVTTPSGQVLSCSSCFTVTGATPSVTSVTPASGGQGAINLPITVNGNNFSRGEQITITDVSVHDVVFVSRTQLTAKVDIPADAPTGAKTVKATNADGINSGSLANGFTVSAPPSPTGVSPASYGQGAKDVKITVTGPGFVTGSSQATSTTASFGPGVTVTAVTVTQGTEIPIIAPDPDDTLVATVTIDENAAAIQRDVVVTNPDGGVGTLAKAFSVNFGPKVTGVVPGFLAPDAKDKPITINGSNFSTTSGKTAVPTITDVTLSNVVVAANGQSITATATVNSGAAKGAKEVRVTNPTDSGAGTCITCMYVATPPGPPTAVKTVSVSATTITAGWGAPSDNGGAPVTSYVVSAKDPAGKAAGTPATTAGNATQGTVTGLLVNVRYTISVIARNVAGDSVPGTTQAQTQGTAGLPLTLAISPNVLNIGRLSTVTAGGSPGHAVQLFAYSRPSTTYKVIRTGTLGSNGKIVWTVGPRTNTRLFVRDVTAGLYSSTGTITVRPALSIFGSATGKTAKFNGGYVPGQAGAAIRIYTVKNGVISSSPVGSATTDSNGKWTYSRTFAATGSVTFIVQSLANLTNGAGQGNRITLTFS